MKDHYQVRFRLKGREIYGIVVEKRMKAGRVRVEDAILPICYRVVEKDLYDIPNKFQSEYDDYICSEFDKAKKRSNYIKGLAPGKLLSLAMGDGFAWYVVTKVGKTRVTVEWRGFCPDRWTGQALGWGGTFDRKVMELLVSREDFLRELFNKHKKREKREAKKGVNEEC